jgi:hypothetical protein
MRRHGFASVTLIMPFLIMALLVTGCGRKTLPVPPQGLVAVSVVDLTSTMNENGVELVWTAPQATTQGEPLTMVAGYDVLRAEVAAARYCAECPATFSLREKMDGGPVAVDGLAVRLRFRDTGLVPHNYYIYKVRSRSGWFTTSGDSNWMALLWEMPVDAPTGLLLTPSDGTLTLSWEPPATLADSKPVPGPLLFQVERSDDGHVFQPVGKPLGANVFQDTGLTNGHPYWYRVRARQAAGDPNGFGAASIAALGTPADLRPLQLPTGLNGMRTNEGVSLWWDAPLRPDVVAGFRVYRRIPSATVAELIGETRGPGHFDDHATPFGEHVCFYSVAAFDHGVPPNEGPRSKEIEINLHQRESR